MSRPRVRPGRVLADRVRREFGRIQRWHRFSIRRRILVAMLAVSVIPLAIFSLAEMAALSGLNSGALKSANTQLEASQDGHLKDLVESKAQVVNDELESVQDEVALLSRSTGELLTQPPSQPEAASGISIYGPGSHAAQPGPDVLALQSLSSQLALVDQLHPEVADVWVQLPGSGLVAVSPATAIPSAQKASQSELSPPESAYQEGVSRLAAALDSPHWRSLLPQSAQTVVWTPVYNNPAAGGRTVTVATETTTANGIAFWVGANITVKSLVSNFLTKSPGHSEGGYAFLVSSDGTLLSYSPGGGADLGNTAHHNPEAPLDLLSKTSPWFGVGSSMTRGLSGQRQITLDGAAVSVFFSPLPASQWSLGVGIPVSGIDGSVVGFSQTITHGLVGVTALLLPFLLILAALVVILTDVLSRRLLHPLSNLTGASRRIAGGDLATPVTVTPGPSDEIGTLEMALEGMRNRLAGQRQLIDAAHRHLEKRVEARTSELQQRNEELATLNSVSADLSRSLVLSDVATSAADRLRQLWNVSEVSVYLLDGTLSDGIRLVGRAVDGDRQPEPGSSELALALEQSQQSPATPVQVDDLVVVPLLVTGTHVGYLVLRQDQVPGQRQVEMLEVVGGQLALALRNAQLFADTQEMATLNERNRIAREIHDTLAQGLAGIVVQLQAAEAWLDREPGRARQAVDQATDLARSSLQEARRSVWDLRPKELQRSDLVAAIREELDRGQEHSAVIGKLEVRGSVPSLSPPAEVAAFRIAKESFANALHHGHPTTIEVTVASEGANLVLEVRDDGTGFDLSAPSRQGAFGITSMRERAAACGGTLELISWPGRGTTVVLRLPALEPAPTEVMG
ncbi:MAG: histidine kinase [Candidatus Dormiibacterota bacterium]